jgi:hypothetical protein
MTHESQQVENQSVHIDFRERLGNALDSARSAQHMLRLSLGQIVPAYDAPYAVSFWRGERHRWMNSARFWRDRLRPQTARDLHTVRAWIRGKHLIVYVRTQNLNQHEVLHCECCGAAITHPQAAFFWTELAASMPTHYRLCGFCDVQAKVLANQFVRDLRAAIFDPEQVIVGWPDRRNDRRSAHHAQ